MNFTDPTISLGYNVDTLSVYTAVMAIEIGLWARFGVIVIRFDAIRFDSTICLRSAEQQNGTRKIWTVCTLPTWNII